MPREWWLRFSDRRASYPHVCVSCRRSFKRWVQSPAPEFAACPECGQPAARVAKKFKPPPRQKPDQWEKVAALLRAGYRFESVNGVYPKTLAEVPEFLANTQPRAIKPYDN